MDLITLHDNALTHALTVIRSGASSDKTAPHHLPTIPKGHLQELEKGFLFSRWFILTYQAAVLCIIAVVTACRQYQSWERRRRAQIKERKQRRRGKRVARDRCVKQDAEIVAQERDGLGNSSSGSSRSSSSSINTKGGTLANDKEVEDERTRLLSPARASRQPYTGLAPWRYLQAALMYQAAPIPFIHKVLPPNHTSLWILFLFALNVFYLVFGIGVSASMQDIVADRAGLLFVANLPWLYLVAAKNQPIKYLTGDSYENLNLLHRRLGEWMCLLAAVHLAGMIWGWYDFLRPPGISLLSLLTIRYILWGCVAWFCYELLYFLSLGTFREWWYEVFLGSHIFLQVAALVTLFLHHYHARPYIVVSFLFFVLDRFTCRIRSKTCTVRAELKVLQDGDTVLVSANWPVLSKSGRWWRSILGWNLRYGWKPSEHVFISVPEISRKHQWQFHPMTIASAAPVLASDHGESHAWFNLIIRAQGGFSRSLLHYAQSHSMVEMKLDGPYGSLHALEMLHASDTAIIVAGGSGIAVAYPLLWSLLRPRDNDVESARLRQQKVCLIWIIQHSSHISWIERERLEELEEMGLHLVMPPPSREQGRPNVKALLDRKVDELCEGEEAIGVVVSGPDSLNRTVQNCCGGIVKGGRNIEVIVEKFGW